MTHAQSLAPDDVTPEFIRDAAREAGLELMPGAFLTVRGGKVVGCCASGALAVKVDPSVAEFPGRVYTALDKSGLPLAFRAGLVSGFDHPEREVHADASPWRARGHAIGRATRRLNAGGAA